MCTCDFCTGKKNWEDNWCVRCGEVQMESPKYWENMDVCDKCEEILEKEQTMEFKEFQETCKNTCNPESKLWAWALGVAGEAGEVADIIKKVLDHKVTEIKGLPWDEALEEELGDVLFYIAAICNHLGLDMGSVAEKNVVKLMKRYPDGFKSGGGIR